MLFSLLAGAAADVWDRRSVMLVAQVAMLLASAALSLLAYLGLVTPWLLLGLTFLLGCGAALYGPAWQSSVGEQVPRDVLPAAVALNSLGFNIARTVGPAIGGIVVAAAGAQAAFLLNALSYIGLIVVLLTWKRPAAPNPLPPETVGVAMRAGLRYVRPFSLLAACLGLELAHDRNQIRFREPVMPDFLDEVVIRNLRLGASRVDVRLHRYGRDISANVLSREGSLRVAVLK